MPVALFDASTGAAAGSWWHVIDCARSLRSSAVVALPDLYRSASRATPRSLVSSVYSDHHNEQVGDPRRKVRFQGLDLYSLRASMDAVVAYLDRVDPDEARRAGDRMDRGRRAVLRRAERRRRARRRRVLPQMYRAEVSSWNLRDRHVANSTSADSHANASASTRVTRSNPGTHPTGI